MSSLPYVTSPGNIDKALIGIRSAAVPERVSQDFVKTVLKIPGGSGDQMAAFLKKLGLASSDGVPNENYRKFRNPSSSKSAIANAIRVAYAPLYVRNEYMHELDENGLLGLVVEETGQAHDSSSVRCIVSCIKRLKAFAEFSHNSEVEATSTSSTEVNPEAVPRRTLGREQASIGLNLGYTINLNLPASSDPAVFDAIFKSLREHLLRQEDA